MSPEEQLEVDELKQKLRTSDKLLADANGRIKAVELESYEVKRNAQKKLEEANAIQAETTAALETAREQFTVAHTVGLAIYGMAELGRSYMSRLVASARMLHRENGHADLLMQMSEAVTKGNSDQLRSLASTARERVAVIRKDQEDIRNKAIDLHLGFGFEHFEEVWIDLLTKERTNV